MKTTTSECDDTPVPEIGESVSRAQKDSIRIRETFLRQLEMVRGKGVFTLRSLSATICPGGTNYQYRQAITFIHMAEIHPFINVVRYFGKHGQQQFQFNDAWGNGEHTAIERMRVLADRIKDASVYDTRIQGDAHELLTLLGGCH